MSQGFVRRATSSIPLRDIPSRFIVLRLSPTLSYRLIRRAGKPYAVVSSISVYHTITCLLPYLTGLCKEGGKSHAVYSISVFRATSSGTSSWTVYRRYSDFDDLHLHIKEKVTVSDLKDWNKHKIYCL